MQKYAVVFFPKLETDKIQKFREKYDPFCKIIPPHITIVSPFSHIPQQDCINHIKENCKKIKSFSITLTGITKTLDNHLFYWLKMATKK